MDWIDKFAIAASILKVLKDGSTDINQKLKKAVYVKRLAFILEIIQIIPIIILLIQTDTRFNNLDFTGYEEQNKIINVDSNEFIDHDCYLGQRIMNNKELINLCCRCNLNTNSFQKFNIAFGTIYIFFGILQLLLKEYKIGYLIAGSFQSTFGMAFYYVSVQFRLDVCIECSQIYLVSLWIPAASLLCLFAYFKFQRRCVKLMFILGHGIILFFSDSLYLIFYAILLSHLGDKSGIVASSISVISKIGEAFYNYKQFDLHLKEQKIHNKNQQNTLIL